MITSEHIDLLATALAAAQGEYVQVLKTEDNPHLKSKYETLEAVLAATRPSLSKNGIAFVQGASYAEGRVVVTTKLIHKSGQSIETHLSIKPTADTAQAIGSAMTYGKRYGGKAILGVDAEKDDDGHAASDTKSIEAENQRLKDHADKMAKYIEDLQHQIIELKNPKKPPRIFSQKDLKMVANLEKYLEDKKIAADMRIKVMDYMEGKNIDTELAPYIERIKSGEIN